MVNSQIQLFKKLYLKDGQIENIIVVDDYISAIVGKNVLELEESSVEAPVVEKFLEQIRAKSNQQAAKALDMPEENIPLLYISGILINRIAKMMGANLIWAPGVTLCDGMAYEYAQKHKIIREEHDFEQDIIACAQNISKRYMGSKRRGETLEKIALTIFDSMKKVHGLGTVSYTHLTLPTIRRV